MITITTSFAEAVFTASAVASTIDRLQTHCADTDAHYGKLSDIYRDHINVLEGAYEVLSKACEAEGLTMPDRQNTED